MFCLFRNKNLIATLRRITAWVLVAVLLCGLPIINVAQASGNGTVKVKLTRLGSVSILKMSVDCNYVLSGSVKMNIPAGSSISVSASGGQLTVQQNGVKVYCGSNVALLRCGSGTSGIRFSSLSNVFCGDLYLSASGSTIIPVLHIYIEDYLYGVVAYEMSNSFPLEALKAQAVSARNYVLKKMSSGGSSYHVTDTSSDQVFKGYNGSYSRVIQAVNETSGQALYAGSSLASCYYSASNGGQTEATANAWGGKLSYSVVKDDPYDLENASAKKTTAVISKDATGLKVSLTDALLDGAQNVLISAGADLDTAQITSIDAISPCNPKYASPSRLYKTLSFSISLKAKNARTGLMVYTSATVDIPTYGGLESWYGLSINSASNETVAVEETADAFHVVFRRWGHGIGMSQRGAQTMASAHGKDHDFILDFYYPGTKLKTLSLSRPGSHGSVRVDGDVLAQVRTNAAAGLYTAADISASVRAEISAGVLLDVYDMNESWAAVGILGLTGYMPIEYLDGLPQPTDTPTLEPSATPEPTATATPEPTATATPEPTATATPEPTATATPEPTATVTPEPTATVTPEPTATATPEPTATATPEPTATMPVFMPTTVPTATLPAFTPTVRPTATIVFLPTSTPRPTATATVAPTATPTKTPTATPSAIPTAAPTVQATLQPTEVPGFVPLPTVMDKPMPTPAPAPEGAEGMLVATGTLYAYVKVSSGSSLALRKAASTNSAPLAYLKNGAQVQLLAFDDDWAYVRSTSGLCGFAARRYLYLPGSSDDSLPTVEDTPKDEPTDAGNDKNLSSSQKFKEVKTNITFCNIAARTKAAVKVYNSYSTSSAVLGSLPASTLVTVTAYNSSWAYVKIGSKRGFIQLKYLRAE